MNWPVESIVIPATLGTSALSGVLGMAGGLILMGVCTSVLPVAQAMVVHGMAQSTSNAARTWVLRAHLHQRIFVSMIQDLLQLPFLLHKVEQ